MLENILKKYQVIKKTEKAICLMTETCGIYGGRFISWKTWIPKSALIVTESGELWAERWFFQNFRQSNNKTIEKFLKIGEKAFDEQ